MGRNKQHIPANPRYEVKARVFMDWYALNMEKLKYRVKDYNEDLFTDAFLRAYDAIARHGTDVKDYTGYFLQTYRSTFLDSKKTPDNGYTDERVINNLTAAEFDADSYEQAVEEINAEMLEYVRLNYSELHAALFEIYVGLSPDVSYKRMASMLGISAYTIWRSIGQIKKDLVTRFGDKKNNLLSRVNKVDF